MPVLDSQTQKCTHKSGHKDRSLLFARVKLRLPLRKRPSNSISRTLVVVALLSRVCARVQRSPTHKTTHFATFTLKIYFETQIFFKNQTFFFAHVS